MKDRIIHGFNKGAKTYNEACIVQEKVAEKLINRVTMHDLSYGNRILEIGCGTGIFSRKLIKQFPTASLVLTDISPHMVSICKDTFRENPHISVECMDGEQLASNQSFDLIVSNMTLHWFTDIHASFRKIINHLKPGAQFIFSMLGQNSFKEWHSLWKQNFEAVPTPIFPRIEEIDTNVLSLSVCTETHYHSYQSLYDFLSSLKKIGATACSETYSSLSIGQLRPLFRQFNSEFKVNYEIIYGNLRNA